MAYKNNANNTFLTGLFQQTHIEALQKNEEFRLQWTKNLEDHKTLHSMLQTLPNSLSLDVMVPIGSRALMKGKIVHTNEILVCLGAGWFVKQSAKCAVEVCDRRIALCNDMLAKLDKERELLSSRKELPFDQEAFGNEIREVYEEEAEAKWRVQHREKEHSYHQQLKQERDEQKVSKTEEELRNRLEELELQEEMQNELDRFHSESALQDSKYHEESVPSSEPTTSDDTSSDQLNKVPPKRRVSFGGEKVNETAEEYGDTDSGDEPVYIHFKHSSTSTPSKNISNINEEILSPADIYNIVPKKVPKSILKHTSYNYNKYVNEMSSSTVEKFQSAMSEELNTVIDQPVAFGDVVERNTEEVLSDNIELPQKRPVSRFRASRKT